MRKLAVKSVLLGLVAAAGLSASGCGLGSSSSDPAAGPAGTATIKLDGGAAYGGGGAGDLYVTADTGITFSSTGSVDASFPVPDYAWTSQGMTNDVTVSANTTVAVYAGGGLLPAADTLFVIPGDTTLYKSNGTGQVATTVSGLKVNGGVTLTLPANATYGGSALEIASLSFPGDVEINGTVKGAGLDTVYVDNSSYFMPQREGADATARDKAGVKLEAYRVLVGTNGAINTAGADGAAGERGGDAGAVELYASNGLVNRGAIVANGGAGNGAAGGNGPTLAFDAEGKVYLFNINGSLLNTGSISASGGTGTVGGNPSAVQFEAQGNVINTGAITASGADGTGVPAAPTAVGPRALGPGVGGSANGIYITSYNASVLNSGTLTTKGGNGTVLGGTGGRAFLSAGNRGAIGNVKNSGAILTSGGSATTSGAGGDAGPVRFTANGSVLDSGSITSVGGSGKVDGNGGNGGNLDVNVSYSSDSDWNNFNAPGPVRFSGSLNLAGGAGGASAVSTGGSGGSIDVDLDAYGEGNTSGYTFPSQLPVEFVGYAGLAANGGAGNGGNGGSGGSVEAYTYESYALDEDLWLPAGPISNSVPLSLRGGDGVTASGNGGYVDFETYSEYSLVVSPNAAFQLSTVTNAGDIDLRAGAASGAGVTASYGGDVYMYGYNKVANSGSIAADGGAATGLSGTGGRGGNDIEFSSTYDVVNSGNLSTSGGNGTNGNGGGGTNVYMSAGGVVTTTGSVRANGGNANAEGTNGDGGYIDLYSQGGGTTYSALQAAKGTGGTGGTDGTIFVDNVQLFGPVQLPG